MHAPRRSALLAILVLVAGLAGCMGGGGSESSDPGNGTQGNGNGNANGSGTVATPPTTTTNGSRAHFRVSDIAILAPDGKARPLYEDDANATIRYTVLQPEDAPGPETAFVSFILNGKLVDAAQIRLEPGQERDYERLVEDVREMGTLRVEVRAGSSVMKNQTTIQEWPRAGTDSLRIGPLTVRADYGLLEQDGKVLVNLTLRNDGTEEIDDFRVKMLCADASGEIQTTRSIDTPAPTPGNSTGVDVLVEDCGTGETRYGLEAKGKDSTGQLWGRLLLVPEGWRPTDPSGTA